MSLFGRSIDDDHPYAKNLEGLIAPVADVQQRSMGRNMMHDDRVSASREADLQMRPDRLERDVRHYHELKVRHTADPEFLNESKNRQNVLGMFENGDILLVRGLNLNGLWPVYKSAANSNLDPVFREPFAGRRRYMRGDANDPDHDRRIADWLDNRLLNKPESEQEDFVAKILEAINVAGRRAPYNPSWCALGWNTKNYVQNVKAGRSTPQHLLEVLGVPVWAPNQWMVILRYRAREAVALVRPTALDAGWSALHFPSPKGLENARGGCAMDLRVPRPNVKLLPEFIHAAIEHTKEHIYYIQRSTEELSSDDLAEQRTQHLKKLGKEHPAEAGGQWMPVAC